MQKKRLGCISLTGILASLLTSLVLGGLGVVRGGAMFSPGELNDQAGERILGGIQSHAETGGRCAACHSAPWQKVTMAERCLNCHIDLTSDHNNFHTVMLTQSRSLTCNGCHTDHNGQNASLTRMNLSNFPHLSVGFSLQVHRKTSLGVDFSCSDCHGSDLSQFDLENCGECHTRIDRYFTQEHFQTFGPYCLECHDGVDRYGGRFDHNLLPFQLVGKHSNATCADCHSGAQSLVELQATRQDCLGCHAKDDPHQGQFEQDCGSCHTPEDWQQVVFDHSLTAFALTGAHVDVECVGCHTNNLYKVSSSECITCHSDPDYHNGLFSPDCTLCHATSAWLPAQFQSAHTFPINHADERDNACRTCHPIRLTEYTCYGCHEHAPAEITSEHQKDGIFEIADCVRCHPTGLEEEQRD